MAKSEINKKKLTRFPISRLKRIMQLNEDIGKIGASVPVVASKAIELFLSELVTLTVGEAKSRSSTRLAPEFIAKVMDNNLKFSFLRNLPAFKNE
jgi:Dr1-associated corepressor